MKNMLLVTTDCGEALISLDDIQWIHWTNNVRRTQTDATIQIRNGDAMRVLDFPQQAVMATVEDIRVVPAQFVPVEDEKAPT